MRGTETIVGYAGVDWFDLDGRRELEFGYRLVPEAQWVVGYATEAGRALLDLARSTFRGTLYGLIEPTNTASSGVIAKLGFTLLEGAPDRWPHPRRLPLERAERT